MDLNDGRREEDGRSASGERWESVKTMRCGTGRATVGKKNHLGERRMVDVLRLENVASHGNNTDQIQAVEFMG
jgi:hypothetical protein